MKQTLRTALIVTLICAIPFALAAAIGAERPTTVWLNAPGWSRAHVVGTTVLEEPAPPVIDARGGAYLLLAQGRGNASELQVLALDRAVTTRWEQRIATGAPPRQPRMVALDDTLRVFWLAEDQLYGAALDMSGVILREPAPLAQGVESFTVASDSDGQGELWFGGTAEQPGVYALSLEDITSPRQIDAAGLEPRIRIDAAGMLHATWQTLDAAGNLALRYAALRPGSAPATPWQIASIPRPDAGTNLQGPEFGIDATHGYLFWSTRITSGMNAGAVFTQYVTFPLNEPARASAIQNLTLPREARPRYTEPQAAILNAGPRISLKDWPANAGAAPVALSANSAAAAELALIGEMQISAGDRRGAQAGMIFFRDGQSTTYQVLSAGSRSAFNPAISSDNNGYLYATWREVDPAGAAVYVASTAPDIRQALSALSTRDIAQIAADIIFGMLAGIVIAPISLLFWLAPVLIALLPGWWLRGRTSKPARIATLAICLLAGGIFWAAKLSLFEQAREYVPFSGWIPLIPASMALPLQLGAPLLIASIGLLIAWALTYRQQRAEPLLFTLIYAAVDGLLTMAVYGEYLFTQS